MSAARKADGDDEILSADGGLFLIVAALFVALVLAGGAAFMLLKKQPHKPRVMGASAGPAPDEPEQVEADDEISFDAKVDAAAAAIELEVVVDNPTQHELGIIVDDDDDDEPLPPMYGRASAPAASFDAKVDAAAAAAQKADGRASPRPRRASLPRSRRRPPPRGTRTASKPRSRRRPPPRGTRAWTMRPAVQRSKSISKQNC